MTMANPELSNAKLHHTILDFIVKYGYAPEKRELAELIDVSEYEVGPALERLQDYHGVVLHPKSHKIWVAHPFSLAPSSFHVSTTDGEWWASCAWCALGAAGLLGRDVDITTTLGATDRQVTVSIRSGSLCDNRYCVHFPIPMRNAWDNVVYTCSTMLLFENELQVDSWCDSFRIPRGDVQPVSLVWEFAKVWYGKHLDPNWTKWTFDEAREIFDRFGLKGDIWELPVTGGRF